LSAIQIKAGINKVISPNNVDDSFSIYERKVTPQMAKTLYVGNLPWSTTEDSLTEAFSAHGTVLSSRIITDKETGRSRGFGFVEVDDAAVESMIDAMNGTDFGGRQIVVNEAKPRQG
jgi:RNA recognition motif-containing protein